MLVVSDIRMLRDFGFVTVIDLTVALLGVLVVLPAVLVLAERDSALRVALPAGAPRPRAGAPSARPARRERPAVARRARAAAAGRARSRYGWFVGVVRRRC